MKYVKHVYKNILEGYNELNIGINNALIVVKKLKRASQEAETSIPFVMIASLFSNLFCFWDFNH